MGIKELFLTAIFIVAFDNGRCEFDLGNETDMEIFNKLKYGASVNCSPEQIKVCVPSNECINGKVITKGEFIFDAERIDFLKCENGEVECCLDNKQGSSRTTPKIPTTTTRAPRTTAKTTPAPPSEKYKNVACGRRNEGGTVYRLEQNGPDEADDGEFPWTVVVATRVLEKEKYIGVGSLIHPKAVLTVAHIFNKRSYRKQAFIRAGVHDRKHLTDSDFPYQEIGVSKIIMHEQYDSGRKMHDMALLILAATVTSYHNIGFACLPPPGLAPVLNTVCIVSGWGSSEVGGKYQDKKKVVPLALVASDECEEALIIKGGLKASFKLHDSMMCAGTKDNYICNGDGGAPLVCEINEGDENTPYYQAGIVSWGVGCASEGLPGVYTIVNKTWVDQKMDLNKLSRETYTLPEVDDDEDDYEHEFDK